MTPSLLKKITPSCKYQVFEALLTIKWITEHELKDLCTYCFICSITLIWHVAPLPNKRRRLLEALIIQKHHSERKQGKHHYIQNLMILCIFVLIFAMLFLSMVDVEIYSIKNHLSIWNCGVHCLFKHVCQSTGYLLWRQNPSSQKCSLSCLISVANIEGSCLLWSLSWGGLTDISYFHTHVHVCRQVCLASRSKMERPAIAWSSFFLVVKWQVLALCVCSVTCAFVL